MSRIQGIHEGGEPGRKEERMKRREGGDKNKNTKEKSRRLYEK